VDVRRGDLDRLAQRADAMRARAPFAAQPPEGRTPRERTLRRYLASYGIDSPPRLEPDRRQAGETLVRPLTQIANGKPKPSLVHVVAVAPEPLQGSPMGDAVRGLARGGAVVPWSPPRLERALEPPWTPAKPPEPLSGDAPTDEREEPPLLPRRPAIDP